MRCHPLRWLWGLLPLAVWAWVTVLSERPRIEADLAKRTLDTLKKAGFEWANVTVSGRDVTVLGKALDDSEPTAALRVANNNVWGVRIADAQTELIEKVDTYLWSAAIGEDDSIRLSGYVPNETARRNVVAAVKADFPKAKIDDRMRLARGAPEQTAWINGIKFAAKQLMGLRKGHVDLTGMELSVTGEAQSASTFGAIKTALRSGLPQGVRLAADRVGPPHVSPYVWSAQRADDGIVLAGYVPSDKVREDLLAHARKAFGKVTDKLQLADGAPDSLQRTAMATLDQMVNLKKAVAELKGTQWSLSGTAADEDAAEAIRRTWKGAIPAGFKAVEQLAFPKPEIDQAAIAARKAADEAEARRRADEAAAAADRQRAADASDARRRADEAAAAAAAADRQRAAEAAEAKRRAEEAAAAAERQRAAEAAEAKRRAEEAEAKRVAAVAEERKVEAKRCEQAVRAVSSAGVIRFERASADLHSDSTSTLDRLAKAVNACPGFQVEIEGHTDAEGTPERNKRLSERRAQAIVDRLAALGVGADRMSAVGYGETRPVAPNDTPDNRAKNRRIEFTVKH